MVKYVKAKEFRVLIQRFTQEEEARSLCPLGFGLLTGQGGKQVDELGNEMKRREERRRWDRVREKREKGE